MKSSFGYFDKGGREFVITDPKPVLPLINYCWNEEFISGVNQNGAGRGSFMERAMQYMHPVTRCLILRDENRHFYLADDTGAIWSPGWYPVNTPLDYFEARHGLGYTVISSVFRSIRADLRVFVPLKGALELWTIKLSNYDTRDRNVTCFSFADFLLKGYREYAEYHACLKTTYDAESNALCAFNNAFERDHGWFSAFIASDVKPSGHDGSRSKFLGEYGSIARPEAVIEGKCRNSQGSTEKLVGVLEHRFALKPGQQTTFHVAIGATDSIETTRALCSRFFQPGRIEEEFKKLSGTIEKDIDNIIIETPDEQINVLFNSWIKRAIQLHTEVGTDTGRGFRDVMQAAWGTALYDASGSRKKIVDSLRHQFRAGNTLRGWNPVDDHHYSDGPVWIAPTINTYLKESGNYDFLNEVVPYFDGGQGTIWDHCINSIRHSTEDLGPHGLTRAHYGDWNDSLNGIGIGGKGESVWTSIAMVFSINNALEIAEHVLKDMEIVKELHQRKATLTAAIQAQGWDGNWFLAGINDAGEKVGSHENDEGRMYLNPQTWAIMAGLAQEERLEKILEIIDNELECDYGSLVLKPSYTKPHPGVGRISWLLAGVWENGTTYNHGSAFKVVADTFIGRGDKAYATLKKLLPDNPKNPSTWSGCPPYAITNMFYGPDHPRSGQIFYSWITGTCTWLFRALVHFMIGAQVEYDGLHIHPCLPSTWEKVRLVRSSRNAVYDIEVLNPDQKQTGIIEIKVDGNTLKGTVVPYFNDGAVHRVKVSM